MKLVIGSDHAGFHLKRELANMLRLVGHEVDDVGSHDPDPVDFPDIAKALCGKVKAAPHQKCTTDPHTTAAWSSTFRPAQAQASGLSCHAS